MLESVYQAKLIKRLYKRFPGCFIIKNEAPPQGIPDLTLLWGRFWAILEVKTEMNPQYEPNQEYYLGMFNEMSFAAMICPENEEEVLDELSRTWELRW